MSRPSLSRPSLSRRSLVTGAGAAGAAGLVAAQPATSAAAAPRTRIPTASTLTSSRLSVSRESFGTTAAGRPVDRWTFGSRKGVRIQMLTYGAGIQTVSVPDRRGRRASITLGLRTLAEYEAERTFFGSTIGRFGNRIAGGRFTLDGQTYQVPANDGVNALHGGPEGFDTRVWEAEPIEDGNHVGVRFRYTSPDGEMGFPGALTTTVDYVLDARNRLTISYLATTDKPTVVNLTNHAFWNLGGESGGNVERHWLQIEASRYTPVAPGLIPTGQLPRVAGTAFDFRRPKRIGRDLRDATTQTLLGQGFDHNWVLDGYEEGSSRLRDALAMYDEDSGRWMRCTTTEPGLQFYSGNFLDGSLEGLSGTTYRQADAVCLETQHFPDSPNQPAFPSTVLRPGEAYRTRTRYSFGVAPTPRGR